MTSKIQHTISSAPSILPIRETFGITDAEGNKYPDIIKAFLHARPVTIEEIEQDFLIKSPSSKDTRKYKIQVDAATKRQIKKLGSAACIISYQQRTYGDFALIRLFSWEKTK